MAASLRHHASGQLSSPLFCSTFHLAHSYGGIAGGSRSNARGLCLPLLERHDRRALVGQDVAVRVHANVQLVAELPRLHHGAGMACLSGRLPGQPSVLVSCVCCRARDRPSSSRARGRAMGNMGRIRVRVGWFPPVVSYRGGKSQSSRRPRCARRAARERDRRAAHWGCRPLTRPSWCSSMILVRGVARGNGRSLGARWRFRVARDRQSTAGVGRVAKNDGSRETTPSSCCR